MACCCIYLVELGRTTECLAPPLLLHQSPKNPHTLSPIYLDQPTLQNNHQPPSNQVPHICRAFFTPGDGMVRNEQAKAVMWLTRPKLTSTWAAGFAFNKVCMWSTPTDGGYRPSFTLPTHTLAPPTPTRTNSATPTAARRTILISPRSSTGRNSPSTRASGRGKSTFEASICVGSIMWSFWLL